MIFLQPREASRKSNRRALRPTRCARIYQTQQSTAQSKGNNNRCVCKDSIHIHSIARKALLISEYTYRVPYRTLGFRTTVAILSPRVRCQGFAASGGRGWGVLWTTRGDHPCVSLRVLARVVYAAAVAILSPRVRRQGFAASGGRVWGVPSVIKRNSCLRDSVAPQQYPSFLPSASPWLRIRRERVWGVLVAHQATAEIHSCWSIYSTSLPLSSQYASP